MKYAYSISYEYILKWSTGSLTTQALITDDHTVIYRDDTLFELCSYPREPNVSMGWGKVTSSLNYKNNFDKNGKTGLSYFTFV